MINPEASTALYDSSMVVDDEASDQEHAGPASFAILGKPDTSDEAANLEALPALLTVNSGSESLGKDIIAAGDAEDMTVHAPLPASPTDWPVSRLHARCHAFVQYNYVVS